jgi:hypothetical protein
MISGIHQVRDELVAEKIKINPPRRLSTRGTSQLLGIKIARLFKIRDWNRKMKSRALYWAAIWVQNRCVHCLLSVPCYILLRSNSLPL